jgi:DNA-binding transcriptional LysR family regulator
LRSTFKRWKLTSAADCSIAPPATKGSPRLAIRLLPGWKIPSRPLQVVYVRDRQMTPKLQRFIDFVADRFKSA